VTVQTAEVKKDQDIEELLKNMKGMPGMEGIKMFTVRARPCCTLMYHQA